MARDLRDFLTAEELITWTEDVVDRLLALVEDLNEQQQIGAYHRLLNPPLWEITHALWFLERWALRDVQGRDPYFEAVDETYNSILIRHGQRWATDLKPLPEVRKYGEYLKDAVRHDLRENFENELLVYRILYAVYHGDMHTEAVTFQRQGRGLPAPSFVPDQPPRPDVPPDHDLIDEEVPVPGGTYPLGSARSEPFVFDNEKWAHPVDVDPYRIDRTPVTQGQFLEFVRAGGYEQAEFWSSDSWEWIQLDGFDAPRFWERKGGRWHRRQFDRWLDLEDAAEQVKPMVHVSYYEARAYCRWADRRLPTEVEWDLAATGWGEKTGQLKAEDKPRYPWGDHSPEPDQANLDFSSRGVDSVTGYGKGDTPFGCRQMIGNVWEWNQSVFEPFEEFEPDFYKQYSQPWFGSRYGMRGGSWCTRSRLIRTGFRNFYTPDRNDRYQGFRTCADDS